LLAVSSPWAVGFTFLEDFEVEGVLGQGGMGIVYQVRQLSSNRSLAVKRARLVHPDSRRRFLAELQLWTDLPPHPHLVPCRFFRTVEEEVVIFMDLAAGGSLADWIIRGQLRQSADVLDVAIQVAWGLHALHERGFVHQDVKPANVLMTAQGMAQVADFGLGRARARLLAPGGPEGSSTVLVSGGAMTPAYCSPEQATGKPVSRKTDLWSWGVLVLEMFSGQVPCCKAGGRHAGEVLEASFGESGAAGSCERMPAAVVEILRRCFRQTPGERWPDLACVADRLAELHHELTGQDYPRENPSTTSPAAPPLLAPQRQTGLVGGSRSPRQWLTLAWQAAGRDPTEAEAVLPPPATSRRAQAVADLAVFEETRALLDQLIEQGQTNLEPHLAALYVQKAAVHVSVSYWPGALDLFEQATALWQRLIYRDRRQELTPNLVRTHLARASALRSLGENQEAIAFCDQVINLWQRLDNRRARHELREDLAAAYLNKGLAQRSLGETRLALDLYGKAVELFVQLVEREEQEELANELAQAYLSQASVLSALGEQRQALQRCDEAIQIRRRLVQREGRNELKGDLARAFLHKASVFRAQDNPAAGVSLYEQALALLTRVVREEGRDDLEPELARAYLSFARARRSLDDPAGAVALCEQAVAVWERLVYQEGRPELQPDLARAYLHRANALRENGACPEAVADYDRADSLYEQLLAGEDRPELANERARVWVHKAQALRGLGEREQARALYERAMELRGRVIEQTGRDDVEADRARDRVGLAELLLDMGDREGGQRELNGAIEELERLVGPTRRMDLRGALNKARRMLRELEREETEPEQT
jgi:serine/threonine protein kinase/tetratricopeptide (TPR) repeat protein